GLPVGSTRCHAHKSAARRQADYYSLYGVFASSEQPLELPLIEEPARVPGGEEFEKQAAAKRREVEQMLDSQYALLPKAARQRVGDYLVSAAPTDPDPLETPI